MKKILTIIGLTLAVVGLTGCGMAIEKHEETRTSEDKQQDEKPNKGIVQGSIESGLGKADSDDALGVGDNHYVYKVKNQTEKEKTFTFTSGMEFDYIVKDLEGNKIIQGSSFMSYMQMIQEKTLKQGEEWAYPFSVENVDSGQYLLEVFLTPKDGPLYKEEIEITIE